MEIFVKKDKAQNRKKMIISFINFYYEKKHITTSFMPVVVMKDNAHVTTITINVPLIWKVGEIIFF
jgi:hypothetical protein